MRLVVFSKGEGERERDVSRRPLRNNWSQIWFIADQTFGSGREMMMKVMMTSLFFSPSTVLEGKKQVRKDLIIYPGGINGVTDALTYNSQFRHL